MPFGSVWTSSRTRRTECSSERRVSPPISRRTPPTIRTNCAEVSICWWIYGGRIITGMCPGFGLLSKPLGIRRTVLRVLLVQFVNLVREGQKISMSTRSAEFITLREVLEEVGPDAARFFFLTKRCDSHLDFDLDLAKKTIPRQPRLLCAIRSRACGKHFSNSRGAEHRRGYYRPRPHRSVACRRAKNNETSGRLSGHALRSSRGTGTSSDNILSHGARGTLSCLLSRQQGTDRGCTTEKGPALPRGGCSPSGGQRPQHPWSDRAGSDVKRRMGLRRLLYGKPPAGRMKPSRPIPSDDNRPPKNGRLTLAVAALVIIMIVLGILNVKLIRDRSMAGKSFGPSIPSQPEPIPSAVTARVPYACNKSAGDAPPR